jgi:putative ABC transport system permease protein
MAAQLALALVLLIGSGLLFRTFRQLRAVDPGFQPRSALLFHIGLPTSRYSTRADALRFQSTVLDALRALPGVTSAGAVGPCLPLTPSMCWGETLEAEGRPPVPGQVPPVTGARVATTGYFETLGIRVRGRTFTAADEHGDATVAILSEAAAAAYFPGEDPIGRRIRFGNSGPWHLIVGIAADVRGRMESSDDAEQLSRSIYLPMLPEAQLGPGPDELTFVVATAVSPTSIVPAVRSIVDRLDPAIPIADVRTLQQMLDRATAPTAFALTLVALAAAIALLLGAVGVYAVVAYTVSRRTAEIGVRMALGARAADVRMMVLRQSGSVILTGITVGLVAAFALTRLMEGMLHGVSPTDPASYAAVTLLLAVIAGLALWLPAHRASRVDPLEALRSD